MDATLRDLLLETCRREASDLYLKAGSLPNVRIEGITHPLDRPALAEDDVETMVRSVLRPRDADLLEAENSVNLARMVEGAGRFRIIAYRQQGTLALVARRIRADIPTIESLGLPPILNALTRERSGLILVTGATGSGKSTTLAAMIQHRNATTPGHIVTIEDPIEFVHHDQRSIVTQRELGVDCDSFERALQDALRQAPDVLLIGEVREREVMEQALMFAETGHLVMGTLHSTNANQALERVLGFFPTNHHSQILMQMSLSLKAIVAQRLLMKRDGTGRIAAVELLLGTQRARELIRQGDTDGLKQLMRSGAEHGMLTFDEALFDLAKQGVVTREAALAAADSPADLNLRFRGFQAMSVS